MRRALISAVVIGSIAGEVEAQEFAVARMDVSQAVDIQKTPRKIDVAFKNTPVPEAVRAVVQKSGLTLLYVESVLPVSRIVTYKQANVDAVRALEEILRGSGVVVREAEGGAFKLVKDGKLAAQGTIVGKIIHAKTKQPVSGATIVLDETGAKVITGADGTFRVTADAGEHAITVRAVGFIRQIRKVTVESDRVVNLEIVLEPSASVLDEVIVTGTVVATERKEIPTPITVITQEEIERRGITRIEDLMRGDIPGVIALDQGTTVYEEGIQGFDNLGGMVTGNVYSRGGAGFTTSEMGKTSPLKTYIDGVELLDASYLGTIDPRTIERIEIITGPQAATIYGSSAMGGVMQIFTKKGPDYGSHDLRAQLRFGFLQNSLSSGITPSHAHSVGVSGSIGPAFSYSSTASYDYTGQWQPDLSNRRFSGSAGIAATIERFTVNASFMSSATTNGTRAIGAGGLKASALQASGAWVPTNTTYKMSSQRVSKSSNQTFSLSVDHRLASWWMHHATVGRSQNKFAMEPQSPRFLQPSDTLFLFQEGVGGRVNWSYNTSIHQAYTSIMTSALTLGLSGSGGDQTRFGACLAERTSTTYLACGPRSFQSVGVNKSIDDNSWGGFGSWRIGVFDQLFLTLGLRGEKNANYGNEHEIDWTPTNGIAYTFGYRDLTIKLLGSYGRATRTPPPDARLAEIRCSLYSEPACYTARASNPLIRAERSRGPQGGMEVYWGNLFSFGVNHYSQRVTDLLMVRPVDSAEYKSISDGNFYFREVTQWGNIASIRQYGWELTGHVNLMAVSVQANYSWNEARIGDLNPSWSFPGAAFGAIQSGGSFTNAPSHFGSLRFSYSSGGTNVSVSGSFIGKTLRSSAIALGGDDWYYAIRNARLPMYNVAVNRSSYGLVTEPQYYKSDLVASQRINQWATMTLKVQNLGNSYASESYQNDPSLGRQTFIGLSLRHPLVR